MNKNRIVLSCFEVALPMCNRNSPKVKTLENFEQIYKKKMSVEHFLSVFFEFEAIKEIVSIKNKLKLEDQGLFIEESKRIPADASSSNHSRYNNFTSNVRLPGK